ncbi:MAG TPA: hypothetical protein DCR90_03510 [Fusobacteriaceae bacterium]|nr:hypothetical protein [Fusobacteriaceae bacterium]
MKKLLLILAVSGFIISCSVSEPVEKKLDLINIEVVQNRLTKTNWKLSKYLLDGKLEKVSIDSKADLRFEDEKIYGDGGVNRYFGSYRIDNNNISIEKIGTTLMMGPEDIMKQEHLFIKLLQEVRSYKIVGKELKLLDDEKVLLVLTTIESN